MVPFVNGQGASGDGAPLVLVSSGPVLVEENSPATLRGNGFNLAPAVPVAGGS